jgi:hypothetical protein
MELSYEMFVPSLNGDSCEWADGTDRKPDLPTGF